MQLNNIMLQIIYNKEKKNYEIKLKKKLHKKKIERSFFILISISILRTIPELFFIFSRKVPNLLKAFFYILVDI
jgi:hypothetical protein